MTIEILKGKTMIRYSTEILKFDKKGEKTGWSYIEISAKKSNQLNPGTKVSFQVKGSLDNYAFKQTSLLPMGEGTFILPFNAAMRKATGKRDGDKILVTLELDQSNYILSTDLMVCLKEEPGCLKYFQSLPGSHQKYFSKWIESAKTGETKAKRIAMSLIAFSKKQGYGEMIRENKSKSN